MNRTSIRIILFFIHYFLFTCILYAQSDEPVYSRRITWQEDENVYRYAVEVDKMENGAFKSHLREYTAAAFFTLSLPAGEYRYRIVPYDVLNRPIRGMQWVRFEIRPPAASEQKEKKEPNSHYNTLGISAGSSFIDPLIVATIHGSFSLVNYLFIQAGADIGFISAFEEVDSFYSLYPFFNIGCFLPINANIGFYAGTGAGFQYSSYIVSEKKTEFSIFAFNAAAGVNLWNRINVQYTLKTNFKKVNHLASIGYVYRFKEKKK